MVERSLPASLRWSRSAQADFDECLAFIGADNPPAAERWADRIGVRAAHIAQFPRSGRQVPESDNPNHRELIIGNYRLVYAIRESETIIVALIEGHRLLDTRRFDDVE